jgi:hypothetical protein
MAFTYNPLKIREPRLIDAHEQIVEFFLMNDLPFEAKYCPDHPRESTIYYGILVNGKAQYGFVTANKRKGFCGTVFLEDKIRHLEMEGFSKEQIENEPVYATAPDPARFVVLLARAKVNELVFPEEVWG